MNIVAAMLVACAIALAVGPSRRWEHLFPAPRQESAKRTLSRTTVMRGAVIIAGIGVALSVGGLVGIVIGVLVAVVGPRLLGRLESRGSRDRREALHRQSADCADLLAACLVSGAPLASSVDAVGRALGAPIDQPLRALVIAINLGADPVEAWTGLAAEPGLAALSRAAARSSDSGAPLADLLPGIADDLRREARLEAEAAARAAGVKAVAPLAACFLPAFLLLGVIPVVVSIAMPFLRDGMFG